MAKLIAIQTECDMTEAEAISQAKDGDAAAFEDLYQAHCRRVYNLCLRMIKNPAEAEDLTRQAFLQAFRKIGTFRGDSGFSTWLHRVIVNIVLMRLRRRRPTEIVGEDLERRSSNDNGSRRHGSTDSSMLGAIERLNLMRAIRKLPRGYEQFFCCTTSLDTNSGKLAGLLGCSTGCSKSQLHKARKRLRGLLEADQARAQAGMVPAWE